MYVHVEELTIKQTWLDKLDSLEVRQLLGYATDRKYFCQEADRSHKSLSAISFNTFAINTSSLQNDNGKPTSSEHNRQAEPIVFLTKAQCSICCLFESEKNNTKLHNTHRQTKSTVLWSLTMTYALVLMQHQKKTTTWNMASWPHNMVHLLARIMHSSNISLCLSSGSAMCSADVGKQGLSFRNSNMFCILAWQYPAYSLNAH